MKRLAIRTAIAVAGLVPCAAGHAAQPRQATPEVVAVERLKRTYLMCGYTAAVRRLMPSEVALCTDAAHELLEHGFGGDFDRLVSWWQSQRVHERIPPGERRP